MMQFWTGLIIIAIAAALGWWGAQIATDGWKKWKYPNQVSEISASKYEKMVSQVNDEQVSPNSDKFQTTSGGQPDVSSSTSELPSLEKLFRSDFPNLMRSYTGRNIGIKSESSEKTVTIGEQMYLDFPGQSKFLGYYIPMSPDPYGICAFMADEYLTTIKDFESKVSVIGGHVTEFSSTSQEELLFTHRIYIYHEFSFSHQQLADLEKLYKSKGLSVVFRGPAYLSLMWASSKKSQ
jgi:hypothetical protein